MSIRKAKDIKSALLKKGFREHPSHHHYYLSLANNRSAQKLLCCNTFISVMKVAELWNCDNLSNLQRLSRERILLVEAQMGSRLVVVAEIKRQGSFEMASIEDDVVVQAFPSNRTD